MPDVYVTKKDLRSHFYSMSIGDIMYVTRMMINEMDKWLEDNLRITGFRGCYEYVLGSCVHSRLEHDITLFENNCLNGIPFQIDYHESNRYTITLRCKGDVLDMPYKFWNSRSNGKSYVLEQQVNAIWNVKPTKVIFNGPATIVLWSDKTKTIVKRAADELDDPEKALALCLLKKNKELFKLCRKEAKNENSKREEDSISVNEFINRLNKALDIMRNSEEVFFDDGK